MEDEEEKTVNSIGFNASTFTDLWKSEAPRLQGGASRQCNIILYCAPLPRLQGGACGARSGQIFFYTDSKFCQWSITHLHWKRTKREQMN